MIRASHALSATLLACLAAVAVPAHAQFGGGQPTATATVTDLDGTAGNLVRLDFTINGTWDFGDNLNIAFAATSFSSLSNAVVPVDFAASLTQPVQAGLLSGTFGITYNGAGTSTGAKHFIVDAIAKIAGPTGSAITGSGVNGLVSNNRVALYVLPALAPVAPPVPEASTMSMLAAGLLAMGFLRRRQTRA